MTTGFHRPTTVDEAVRLSVDLPGAAYLAGGTELNSAYTSTPPEHLVSLDDLGLDRVELSEDGGVRVGACVTLQQLVASPDVPGCVKEACLHVVNRNIRVQATIGGQIGANKTCGDVLPVLIALGASVELADVNGTGALPVEDYVSNDPDGLITAVTIPALADGRSVALDAYTRTANDLSIITVAVAYGAGAPVVAMGGVGPCVMRLGAVEAGLTGELPSEEAIESLVRDNVNTISDVRGSAEFKKHLAGVLAAKAVHAAAKGVAQ